MSNYLIRLHYDPTPAACTSIISDVFIPHCGSHALLRATRAKSDPQSSPSPPSLFPSLPVLLSNHIHPPPPQERLLEQRGSDHNLQLTPSPSSLLAQRPKPGCTVMPHLSFGPSLPAFLSPRKQAKAQWMSNALRAVREGRGRASHARLDRWPVHAILTHPTPSRPLHSTCSTQHPPHRAITEAQDARTSRYVFGDAHDAHARHVPTPLPIHFRARAGTSTSHPTLDTRLTHSTPLPITVPLREKRKGKEKSQLLMSDERGVGRPPPALAPASPAVPSPTHAPALLDNE
ncbi:hypothetical protein B0H14DRAFT_3438826 [Mycena olivaceomarginata]|nr:hypothetical protein B0H14DRAFT_3438826 [Mycena olivaceomarginata]